MTEVCPHCGKPTRIASVARCHGMFDMHLFHSFHPNSAIELINMWKDQCLRPYPANVDGRFIEDLGPTSLCPVIVLDNNGKEMRRVGGMLFWPADVEDIATFRRALELDPDIPRLLSEGKTRR